MHHMILAAVALFALHTSAFGQTLNQRLDKVEQQIKETSATKKPTTKITVKDDVVEIYGTDLNDTKDAVYEQSLHTEKKIRVRVAPMSVADVAPLTKKGKTSLYVSRSVTLQEAYREAYEDLLAEIAAEEPATAEKMKGGSTHDNLVIVEKYLGLDHVKEQSHSHIARMRRVCWVEGIYQQASPEKVRLTFE